ncbi:MAG: hypothetical protein V3W17_08860, partial [Desulfobacteria bacterium]
MTAMLAPQISARTRRVAIVCQRSRAWYMAATPFQRVRSYVVHYVKPLRPLGRGFASRAYAPGKENGHFEISP